MIEGRLLTGYLHRLYRGVYAVGRAELSDRGLWMAGVLAAGPDAVLSHRSAAALWDLRPFAAMLVEATSVHGSEQRRLISHESFVPPQERLRHDHIPVTTIPRTLVDLAEVVTQDELDRAVHQAYRLRRFDSAAVASCLERHPSRNGAARLRRALSDHPAGSERSKSWLEMKMLRICRDHGLPLPEVNQYVLGRERDFYWPAHNLVVETDGRNEHLTPRAFEADRERDIELAEAGFKVRRFTYRQVTERPGWVADRIAAALREP